MNLVIDSDGTGHLGYLDLALCPSCALGTAPPGTLTFVLTSMTNGVAVGRVTASSDPKNLVVAEPVTVRLAAGSPGQLLNVVIGSTQLISFCNDSSIGQCGA